MPKRNTSCCVSILELGQMLEQERYIVDILLRTAIQNRPSGGITIFAPEWVVALKFHIHYAIPIHTKYINLKFKCPYSSLSPQVEQLFQFMQIPAAHSDCIKIGEKKDKRIVELTYAKPMEWKQTRGAFLWKTCIRMAREL